MNDLKPTTPPSQERPKASAGTTKKAVVFTAYLLAALPYNMAMAANWQTPAQVAALNTGATPPQATSITITTVPVAERKYFQVTYQDVAKEVARQLEAKGVEKQARATTNPANSNVLHAADHPLKLAVHGLQIDPATRQWQAQAYIVSNGETELVRPIAGHYEGMVSVPVLSHQLRRANVIEASDITMRTIPSRQLRKDTITRAEDLIGKSPRGTISGDRPVRASEITAPILVHRGDPVELTYTTPYMNIATTGTALEDGELGGLVRIKNTKSERAVTGRVVASGRVEANVASGS